jgi:hypothetical protein
VKQKAPGLDGPALNGGHVTKQQSRIPPLLVELVVGEMPLNFQGSVSIVLWCNALGATPEGEVVKQGQMLFQIRDALAAGGIDPGRIELVAPARIAGDGSAEEARRGRRCRPAKLDQGPM